MSVYDFNHLPLTLQILSRFSIIQITFPVSLNKQGCIVVKTKTWFNLLFFTLLEM